MKISLDIDCTPQEARSFFGLPDLESVNAIVTEELERRTRENLDTLSDPQAFWERAMASGAGGMEAFGRLFGQGTKPAARDD